MTMTALRITQATLATVGLGALAMGFALPHPGLSLFGSGVSFSLAVVSFAGLTPFPTRKNRNP